MSVNEILKTEDRMRVKIELDEWPINPNEDYGAELDSPEYLSWGEGDVWGFIIERLVTWQEVGNPENTKESWEEESSCWGYYGYEWAQQSAIEEFNYYVKNKKGDK